MEKNMATDIEIREFAKRAAEAAARELGAEYKVQTKEVRKNNGVVLHGLLILSKDQTVIPTIYLESFLEAYKKGASFESVVQKIISVFREDSPGGGVSMDFFRHFDKVKDRICYRLIGRKGNDELLEEIPHIEFLDMAVCFYYAYQGEALGEGTILIYHSHLEMWDASTADLMKLAEYNTPRLRPWKCYSLESAVEEAEEPFTEGVGMQLDQAEGLAMSVLTNSKKQHGAACILYPNLLESIASRLHQGFYIIPSSVHEVILLTSMGQGDTRGLREMIAEVNSTQVAPEDVLSDNLYYYNYAEKKVQIIF